MAGLCKQRADFGAHTWGSIQQATWAKPREEGRSWERARAPGAIWVLVQRALSLWIQNRHLGRNWSVSDCIANLRMEHVAPLFSSCWSLLKGQQRPTGHIEDSSRPLPFPVCMFRDKQNSSHSLGLWPWYPSVFVENGNCLGKVQVCPGPVRVCLWVRMCCRTQLLEV